MSGKALGWAREVRCSGGLAAKAVLLLMADYADREHQLFPSIPTLAGELETSVSTIQRAIASLVEDGLICREFRATATGKTTSSRYVLAVDSRPSDPAGRGVKLTPLGVSDCEGRGVNLTPSPPSNCDHLSEPRLLTDPESSDELSQRAREAGLEELWTSFEALERVVPPLALDGDRAAAWAAFQVEVLERAAAPETLIAAGAAWRDHPATRKRSFAPVSLARWLSERRWRAYADAASGGEDGARRAPAAEAKPLLVDAPEAVRTAVLSARGEAWARSWLGKASWREADRTLTGLTGIGAERALADVGAELADLDVGVAGPDGVRRIAKPHRLTRTGADGAAKGVGG